MRVRLNHSQGALAIDLMPRGYENPVVIGRSSQADIQLKADTVSRRHALMYVHGSDWVVQDAGSREGTFVNGTRIDGPVLLAPGVEITFGPSGAGGMIEILSLESAPAVAPAPIATTPVATAPVVATPVTSAPTEPVAPVAAAPVDEAPVEAEAPAVEYEEPVAEEEQAVEFGQAFGQAFAGAPLAATAGAAGVPAAAVTTPVHHKRAKKSNGPIIVASVATVIVLLAIGACVYAFHYRNKTIAKRDADAAEAARLAALPPKPKRGPDEASKTIFSEVAPTPKPVAPVTPAVTPPVTPGVPKTGTAGTTGSVPAPATLPATNPSDGAPDEPEAPPADPAWQRVVDAHASAQPPAAIFAYTEYKKTSPAPDKLKEVDKYMAEALDELWWQRINELVAMQTSIDQQIKDLKKEKSELPGDATKERKEQFDKQVKSLESTKASNLLILDGEMGYKKNKPVDVDTGAALEAARKERSKELYEKWCQRVISRIKSTRDSPW